MKASALPTHAQFIRQLGLRCAEWNRKANSHKKALTQAINANDLKKASEILASADSEGGTFVLSVERLAPSAKDRAAFVRYVVLTHKMFGLDERLAAALRARKVTEVTRLDGLVHKVRTQRANAAIDLGPAECGT